MSFATETPGSAKTVCSIPKNGYENLARTFSLFPQDEWVYANQSYCLSLLLQHKEKKESREHLVENVAEKPQVENKELPKSMPKLARREERKILEFFPSVGDATAGMAFLFFLLIVIYGYFTIGVLKSLGLGIVMLLLFFMALVVL